MASFKEYHATIRQVLAQCEQAHPTLDMAQQIFLQTYTLALDDLETTWATNPVWGQDVGNNDFSLHVARLRAVLEQRLTGDLAPRAMTAGAAGSPGVAHEGGP